MTKIKLQPIQQIDLSSINIGQSIEIHADRLAAFKSNLSRYNKLNDTKYRYSYSSFKNDYCTATRKTDRAPVPIS